MPSNVLPLRLKQTFQPIVWIFTEGESDEIESRLPFKIFFTLLGHADISVSHNNLRTLLNFLNLFFFFLEQKTVYYTFLRIRVKVTKMCQKTLTF